MEEKKEEEGEEREAERQRGADKSNRPFAERHAKGTQTVTL